jgi:hypothetical protein
MSDKVLNHEELTKVLAGELGCLPEAVLPILQERKRRGCLDARLKRCLRVLIVIAAPTSEPVPMIRL